MESRRDSAPRSESAILTSAKPALDTSVDRAEVAACSSAQRSARSLSQKGYLELEDGTRFAGTLFGSLRATDGEIVFNTGMVGYVESLTDPSYRGQILALTYPLIGNYGVPPFTPDSERFESDRIQVRGLIVSSYVDAYSHCEAEASLGLWLERQEVVGLSGVDTRELTRTLRSRGTMLGRIVIAEQEDRTGDGSRGVAIRNPNATDLVAEVTPRDVRADPALAQCSPHILVVDCGCKRSIKRELRARGCRLTIVPRDHDLVTVDCDGILLSNGPGDPAICTTTIRSVAQLLSRAGPGAAAGGNETDIPIAGICLGNQLLALAAGARTYKLPFGHRGQNQPVQQVGTERCYVTSQNHGYAVDGESLPEGWEVWFSNLNDGTVEGIRHVSRPFSAVQFHPEGAPGPLDSLDFFDRFVEAVRNRMGAKREEQAESSAQTGGALEARHHG